MGEDNKKPHKRRTSQQLILRKMFPSVFPPPLGASYGPQLSRHQEEQRTQWTKQGRGQPESSRVSHQSNGETDGKQWIWRLRAK